MARRASPQFFPFGFDEPMPPDGGRGRNGVYRGPAPVRELPPGICGEDLSRAERLRIAVGQVWRRGAQRVRITRLSAETVTFRELSFGNATRREPRDRFLRMGFPAQRPGRPRRGHEREDFDDED